MKARVESKKEKLFRLQRDEINRVNKIWFYTFAMKHPHIKVEKLLDDYQHVCTMARELYDNPENWFYIDERFKEWGLDDIFVKEDISEREAAMKIRHKEEGRKWRQY